MKMPSKTIALLAALLAAGILSQAHAAGGKTTTASSTTSSSTDTTASGSKSTSTGGGSNSGGGGGGKSTTTTPKAPVVPITSATLTFAASSSGSCSGDYTILPYYPTLLDLLVNVNISSLNVPDGTVLYVNPVGTTAGIYPYITTPMTVVGGACSSSQHYFIYPNVGVAGVTITDAAGNIYFAGN